MASGWHWLHVRALETELLASQVPLETAAGQVLHGTAAGQIPHFQYQKALPRSVVACHWPAP
jgi:hypothetical protein